MEMYGFSFQREEDLQHHGIKGMKWGVRRFQNEDGSLTAAGRKRYGTVDNLNKAQAYKNANKEYDKAFNEAYKKRGQAYSLSKKKRDAENERWGNVWDKAQNLNDAKAAYKQSQKDARKESPEYARSQNIKKALIIGGTAAVATGLAVYGGYKLNNLATESLKAGDRYLARHKQTMADMALKNYFDQMEIANKVKGPDPITNRTPIETAKKYQKMVETASQAGQRYNAYRKEASAALTRADSGKYSTKEKIDELRRMARR